jgi:hypothetical protein
VLLSDQELVGHRIGVLWPEHASYFLGRITAYSQEAGSFISPVAPCLHEHHQGASRVTTVCQISDAV